MEKKDYLNLQSKYSFLKDYEERYRKGLIEFINDAFEKHGGVFEYKCDTHDTWEEKNEDENDEFCAMDDLPVSLTVWVDDDGGHEVYPIRIRQRVYSSGHKAILVDGWDWYSSDWMEEEEVYGTLDELEAIADFINAVLEQEQKEINL